MSNSVPYLAMARTALSQPAAIVDPDLLEEVSRGLVRDFRLLDCEPEETIRLAAAVRALAVSMRRRRHAA